ncbi:MAG TPA: AI-2E family transporter [Vicinamibacterales bacterium]|nr:AI-2E family transporter [Vicinamibacterales bacterium]
MTIDNVTPAAGPEPTPVASAPEAPAVISISHAALTLLGIAAGLLLLRYTRDVLIPFAISGLLFYALDPAVDWMQRWRVPRALGAFLALAVLMAGAGALVYSLQDDAIATINQLPKGARQLAGVLQRRPSDAPSAVEKVQEAVEVLQANAESARTAKNVVRVQIQEPGFQAGAYLWGKSGAAATAISQAIIVLFLTFFMLLSDQLFKRKLVELGPTLTRKKITVKILEDIAGQIEQFFLVQMGTSLIVGVATWLALWGLGLQQAALWGLLAGVLNSIPYSGPLVVTGGLSIVAFLQFGTLSMTATVAAVSLVITTLEGMVLTPALMGKVAQMNQVTVFAGLLFWSWAWGLGTAAGRPDDDGDQSGLRRCRGSAAARAPPRGLGARSGDTAPRVLVAT